MRRRAIPAPEETSVGRPILSHPMPERPRLQQDVATASTYSRQDVCKFHSRVILGAAVRRRRENLGNSFLEITKFYKTSVHQLRLRSFLLSTFNTNYKNKWRKRMPMQSQEQSTLNVKLVHFTKQNSPDEPVQVAFAVTDDQGKEEIITGEVPYSYDLFHLFQEAGWLNIRRGVASIRENRTQRRAMSA
jgi:hypothetical protein